MSFFTARSLLTAGAAFCAMTSAAAVEAKPVKPAFMPAGELGDAPKGFVDMCVRDKALCMIGANQAARFAAAELPCAHQLASDRTTLSGPTGAIIPADPVSPAPAVARTIAADGTATSCAAQITVTAPRPTPGFASGNDRQLTTLAKRINSEVNRTTIGITDRAAFGIDEYWSRPGTVRGSFGDCEDYAIEKRVRLTEAGFPADRLFYAVAFISGYGLHTVLVARMDDGDYLLDNLSGRVQHWSKASYTWLRLQEPGNPLLWDRYGGTPSSMAAASRSTTAG